MASVEIGSEDQFNQLKQKLSSDLERELSEAEFMELVLQLGTSNYEKLLRIAKHKLSDKGFTQEQYEKALTFVIHDIDDTDLSERVDEILYGE